MHRVLCATELIHNEPGVILRHCHLVQLHIFWPKVKSGLSAKEYVPKNSHFRCIFLYFGVWNNISI
jgi:hypothetical protein